MSLAAISWYFAVLAGTLKSVYLSIMVVDHYHHLELWCGVRTKLNSAQTAGSTSNLQHFSPRLAPVHQSLLSELRATWDKCSHSPRLETKLNLSFVAKDTAGSGKGPSPSQ